MVRVEMGLWRGRLGMELEVVAVNGINQRCYLELDRLVLRTGLLADIMAPQLVYLKRERLRCLLSSIIAVRY